MRQTLTPYPGLLLVILLHAFVMRPANAQTAAAPDTDVEEAETEQPPQIAEGEAGDVEAKQSGDTEQKPEVAPPIPADQSPASAPAKPSSESAPVEATLDGEGQAEAGPTPAPAAPSPGAATPGSDKDSALLQPPAAVAESVSRVLDDSPLSGLFELWLLPYVGDSAASSHYPRANAEGFRLRRARLSYDEEITRGMKVKLSVELGDAPRLPTPLFEAWLEHELPMAAQLRVGYQRIPFDLSSDMPVSQLSLPDRPAAIDLIGNRREAGVSANMHALDGALRGALGLFSASGGQLAPQPENSGLLASGRVSYGYGKIGSQAADLRGGGLRARLGVGAYVSRGGAYDGEGFSVDLRAKWRGLSMQAAHSQGEVAAIHQIQPSSVLAATPRTGSYLQLDYFVRALRLGFSARIETLDDDENAGTEGDVRLYSLGATAHLIPNTLCLRTSYHHALELDRGLTGGVQQIDDDVLTVSVTLTF